MIRAAFAAVVFVSLAASVADLPYKPDPCKELGFLDYSKQTRK